MDNKPSGRPALQRLAVIFENFSKWDSYFEAIDMLDAGQVTVHEVIAAAEKIDISAAVLRDRLVDVRKMLAADISAVVEAPFAVAGER